MMKPMEMQGVREYSEGMAVEIEEAIVALHGDPIRLIIVARNEAGHNCTQVDLLDLLHWVKRNKPELLE